MCWQSSVIILWWYGFINDYSFVAWLFITQFNSYQILKFTKFIIYIIIFLAIIFLGIIENQFNLNMHD